MGTEIRTDDPALPEEGERREPAASGVDDLLVQDRATDRGQRIRKLLHLWVPLLLTLALLLVFGAAHGMPRLLSLVVTAVTAFFAAGKFIILTGVGHPDLGPWELAAMVFYMDVITAFLLAFNLDVIYRIPRVGPALNSLQDYGRYTLRENPRLRKLSFVGLVLFVLFPVAATGAIGGSIFGRLLGMRPYRIVLGIGFGSMVGCGAMALGTEAIREVASDFRDQWWFRVSGFLLVGLLVFVLYRRYRAIEQKIEAEKAGGAE
jgi:uncharacterized membrane protein